MSTHSSVGFLLSIIGLRFKGNKMMTMNIMLYRPIIQCNLVDSKISFITF